MTARETVPSSHRYHKGVRAEYTWGALFTLKSPLALNEIISRLGSVVATFGDPRMGLSGAVLGEGKQPDRSQIVLGLDPSRKYGTPTTHQNNRLADAIGEQCGWRRRPLSMPQMRVLLGRRIGYDGHEYSMAQVRELAGDSKLRFTEADVFSTRYADGLRTYTEPGVIVAGRLTERAAVLALAAAMGQERLVIEEKGRLTQVYER